MARRRDFLAWPINNSQPITVIFDNTCECALRYAAHKSSKINAVNQVKRGVENARDDRGEPTGKAGYSSEWIRAARAQSERRVWPFWQGEKRAVFRCTLRLLVSIVSYSAPKAEFFSLI